MGINVLKKRGALLLLVVLLILSTCSAHKRYRGSKKGKGGGLNPCPPPLIQCFDPFARGLSGVTCGIRCNGEIECSFGNDEMGCPPTPDITTTLFSTSTSTTTTTTTITTTTTSTTTTSSTSTTEALHPITAFTSLTGLFAFDATSSITSTRVTSSYSYTALVTVPTGTYTASEIVCKLRSVTGTVTLSSAVHSVESFTPDVQFTLAATLTCTPSSSYV